MRISINLATRPFVELRPLFARLRLVMAGLAVLAAALGIGLHSMNKKAQVAEAQMQDLKVQTSVVENERAANEARMRQPQNAAVLERSRFLNSLFQSKSFSWTSVMMDLETVLPAGVQVTNIDPVMMADGGMSIRLRVSGPRELQVDLVRNLEHSQRFVSPHVANETAQTTEQGRLVQTAGAGVPGGVEFEIVSGYNPLPPAAKGPAKKDQTQAKPAIATQKTVASKTAGAKVAGATKPPAPVKANKSTANGGAR
jgi:type IV pilus assembly protein PilN